MPDGHRALLHLCGAGASQDHGLTNSLEAAGRAAAAGYAAAIMDRLVSPCATPDDLGLNYSAIAKTSHSVFGSFAR
jgi:hypothetical protein